VLRPIRVGDARHKTVVYAFSIPKNRDDTVKPTDEQRKLLHEDHGIIGNECCDTCGKVLGCVRFTRKGESDEWCSRQCRDGKAQAETVEARRERRAERLGRPAKYPNERARRAAEKAQNASRQRDWRSRMAQSNAKVAVTN